MADARLGERVCIAVVTREGVHIEGAQLLEHLHASGLSKYDMPEYYLALEEFPMTASGKVLKRELVEWTRSGRVTPQPVRWVSREN